VVSWGVSDKNWGKMCCWRYSRARARSPPSVSEEQRPPTKRHSRATRPPGPVARSPTFGPRNVTSVTAVLSQRALSHLDQRKTQRFRHVTTELVRSNQRLVRSDQHKPLPGHDGTAAAPRTKEISPMIPARYEKDHGMARPMARSLQRPISKVRRKTRIGCQPPRAGCVIRPMGIEYHAA